jgi:O-antigen ligase
MRITALSGKILLLALPWLSPYSQGPSPNVHGLFLSAACALIFVAFHALHRDLLTSQHSAPVIAAGNAWRIAALVSAMMALIQYFGLAANFAPWIAATDPGEAFANLRQRNQFATLTNIGLAALLWTNPSANSASRVWTAKTVAKLAAAALLGAANAASASRTGLVQLFGVLLLIWWWSRTQAPGQKRATRGLLIAALLAYALAIWALPLLLGKASATMGAVGRLQAGEHGCSSRLVLWSNVLHLIAQKPWIGWGWGELGYAHFITLYPGERFCDILDNAHNLPLHLAVELGIPAAALFCFAVFWVVARARPWRETDPTRQLAWAVLALIGLHSLVEYPLWYGPFQMALGLCVWMLWQTNVSGPAQALRQSTNTRALRSALVALCLLSLALLAYAAWDYWRVSQIYLDPAERAPDYRENTLQKIQPSRLFANQVKFAELGTEELSADNAEHMRALTLGLLHFSAEPRVVERLIESDIVLGRDGEARFYLERYKAAFAQAHAQWAQQNHLIASNIAP